MKRVIFIILILALSVNAHIGDRLFLIPEIPDESLDELNVRNESLEDWEDVGLYPVLTPPDFFSDPTVGDGAPYDPSDLDYQVWLGWNGSTNRLYFAMERIDDVFVNEYEGGKPNLGDTWRHDGSLEFFVDGDHSGGDYSRSADKDWTDEEKLLAHNRTAQQFLGIADAPDGRHIGYQGAGNEWYTVPPYADGGGGTTGDAPAVSVIEFYVTPGDDIIWNSEADSKFSELFPGKIIGFEIAIPDFDTKPAKYRAFHMLESYYPGRHTWRYSDHFVDGRLVGAQEETPVEAISWARIKASFRSN